MSLKSNKIISGIDLFCGVGGLTHGLSKAGVKINVGIDIDPNCKYPYEANNNAIFLQDDIRNISAKDLDKYFAKNDYRLLAGCAPCQPFSTYSQSTRKIREDSKWDLLLDFARLAKELEPELITMENVPQLVDHPVYKKFLKSLKGYHIWSEIVECTQYGVPQTRKRLVLLASRLGPIKLISPTHLTKPNTVRKVLGKLKPIEAGSVDHTDPLHTSCSLSPINLKRIQASKPGGTWRDWPQSLRADCHKKKSGETFPSVYGRMEWDAPAPTITTQCFGYGNGRFGHPDQDRAISLREAAIIQTFPKNYKFVKKDEKVRFAALGRLIGNAVPVRLGEIVAKSLNEHLKDY